MEVEVVIDTELEMEESRGNLRRRRNVARDAQGVEWDDILTDGGLGYNENRDQYEIRVII